MTDKMFPSLIRATLRIWNTRATLAFSLSMLCAVAVQSGYAATVIWSGANTNVDYNWSDAANWAGGVAPTSTDDVRFFDSGATTTASNLNNTVDAAFGPPDVFARSYIGSLQYGNTNNTHTTLITPGQTLMITNTGGLIVGTPADIAAVRNLTNTITGSGGTLWVSNASANIALNQGSATSLSGLRANLDLSGLANFVASIGRLGLGTSVLPNPGNANQREAGALFLAKTNLLILNYTDTLANYQLAGRTNALEISRNPGNNAGILSLLSLGQTNALFLDSLGFGRDKASASSAGWMGFNSLFSNNNPQAYFRNVDGSSRVTWWAIGDMNASASSSQVSVGTNDFSNGTLDALVNVMSLARDCSPSHTASASIVGVLTFTAGTVDVNTLYVGNQSLGPSGSSTPLLGIVNVNGPTATLIVNNNLVLGNTTQSSIAAQRTTGILNIRNGTVRANLISVGVANTNSVITMTNGLLVISNTVASPAKALTTFNITNSTLQLAVTGVTNIAVTNLVTGGATNIINPATVAVFASYPQQVPLIKYFGAAVGGVGYNFGFGANTLPPTAPGAYLSNNVANKSIDLVLPNDPRPVITSQPASYSGNPGDNVTFTAGISPSSATPLNYQWYLGATPLTDGPTGNGSTLSGSLTASLAITNAQPGDNGNYTLIVTNLYGSATSTPPANLTISSGCVAPSISGGPNNTTVIQGNNAIFSATVAGSPLPDLQWQRAGADIPGATTASYTLTSAQYPADDQAVFCLIATNACGKATNCAILTVIVPPTIGSQPTNLVVTNTQAASFSVTASGVPAPGYQWLKNGSPIAGATTSTLNFASAVPTNAAVYSVVVTNGAGSITSSNATLLVNSTMSVSSLSPANDATGVCVDTLLRITFDTPPVIGTAGKIRIFNVTNSTTPVDTIDLASSSGGGTQPRTIAGSTYNTYPVILSGNTATIFPHLGVLTTNQTYYVTIDDVLGGAFKDSAGATFAGIIANNAWQFTTRAAGPANPTNLVVAAVGSGDFCTVQGVLDFLPSGNTTPRTINIRNGVYQEIVFINGRHDLTLIGQSRDQTIITYANNDNLNGGTSLRPSFRVNGNDNALVNLTLTNATPKGGTQAEALRTDGKRIIVLDVKLASFQDTMLNNNSGDLVYVRDSLIQGDTDFIWGGSTVFFTNCEIRSVTSGTQITQARTSANSNGFSFVSCQLTRPTTSVTGCGLGRDLGFTDNNVAYINCLIDSHITGWQNADARDWEYGNSNLTATAAVSYNGVQLPNNDSRLLLAQSATNWLYGWVPQLAPIILTNPVSQSVAGGTPATFTITALGLPDPSYQWLKDGAPIPGATASAYAIPNAYASNAASYSVIVSNTAGSVTSSNATLSVGNTAPTLSPIPNRTVNVGVTIMFTNSATDPDVPPQTLAFSLLAGPTNATVNALSGVFTWRPLVKQADSTNPISIVVSDNGALSLSATQSFLATVNPLAKPSISSVTFSGGQPLLQVAGDAGPDYEVQASTNLTQWDSVFITNSPATPFQWADPNVNSFPVRFYRIVAGPPLP